MVCSNHSHLKLCIPCAVTLVSLAVTTLPNKQSQNTGTSDTPVFFSWVGLCCDGSSPGELEVWVVHVSFCSRTQAEKPMVMLVLMF